MKFLKLLWDMVGTRTYYGFSFGIMLALLERTHTWYGGAGAVFFLVMTLCRSYEELMESRKS